MSWIVFVQDEAVAYGAAVQAAILSGDVSEKTKNVVLLDVAPLSLGIQTAGGMMSKIIMRNSTLPTRVSQTFSTNVDNQDGVDILVYEGERAQTKDNNLLGEFSIEGIPPMPRGVPQIEVTFDVNSDGIMHIFAVETSSGKSEKITIKNDRGNLSTEGRKSCDHFFERACAVKTIVIFAAFCTLCTDIARMVKEAEEHAAEDAKAQGVIRARNELHEFAYVI